MSFTKICLVFLVFIQMVEAESKAFFIKNQDKLSALQIFEELPVGLLIANVTTSHKADGFKIVGDAAKYFSINTTTGDISIKKRIDRESLQKLLVTGTVTATKAGSRNASTDFRCLINDINDHTPAFPHRLYNVSVSEVTSIGNKIITTAAQDSDSGANGELHYNIVSGNEAGMFSISLYGGQVRLTKKLDFEKKTQFTLNITVQDQPGLSNWTVLVVHVLDADDLPAKFTAYSYSANVKEDALVGTSIIQVLAYDLDKAINDTVTYAIDQGTNTARLFAINTTTGVISLNGTLDRDTVAEYNIRVLAFSSFPVSDHATVIIRVTDVNDNQPVFTSPTYNGTVAENLPVGTVVLQVEATDKDEGLNAKLRFSIQDGVDSNRFIIDHQTGKISTAAMLDREQNDSYTLTVIVQDMDGNTTFGAVLNDTATVFIAVQDANDNAPVFLNSSYSVTINESVAVDAHVIQVEAKDPDVEQNTAYSISAGNKLSRFKIDRDSGLISINGLIDRDPPNNETVFYLQITAEDKGNSALKTTTNVTITVLDVNDNKPLCSKERYSEDVQENATQGTSVMSLTCSDVDSGDNARISYQLVSGGDGKFAINSSLGIIKTTGLLDYETMKSYNLKIEVTDHGQPPLSREISVVINVININDNVPVFSQPKYEFSLLEGNYSGFSLVLGDVVAFDKDANGTDANCGQVRYSIVNTTGIFTINSATGLISTSSVFDRESLDNYTIIVMATDLDPVRPLSSTADVVIHVTDDNDNSPVFSQSRYNVNVSEAETHEVIKVMAHDKDIGRNAKITYSIIAGNLGNSFTIDEVSGQINVSGSLDRETISKYELIVAATDGGRYPRATTVSVDIDVIDVNDHDPVCTQNGLTVKIRENLAPGQIIAKVSATDNDSGLNQKISYRLVSDSFAVNPTTGVINTTRLLDREHQSEYSLSIDVYNYNRGSSTVNCTVQVLVEDENDNSPLFNVPVSSISIPENSTVGLTLIQFNASDRDEGYNGDIMYSFIGDGTKFAINQTTGVLKLISSLDRETESQHSLKIIATDRGVPQSRSSSIELLVNITDVNDNKPVFSSKVYQGHIPEGISNTSVLRVLAVDQDELLNGNIVYTITGGNTGNAFTINATGTIITATPLDRELKDRYDLEITATDRGEPAFSTSATVVIMVTDVNDNAPNITNAPREITIPENTPKGSLVYVLTCEDKDQGSNAHVTYTGSAQPAGTFALNPSTGMITLIGELDREMVQSYNLQVVAIDEGYPPLNSSVVTFDIIISDVNDNNPVFNPLWYTVNVTENAPNGSFVIGLNASEKDADKNGMITYEIESGDRNGYFSIDNTTGVLTTRKSLDRESVDRYNLVIAAMDHGNPPRRGHAYVTVHVKDFNDLSPAFSLREYYGTIKENTGIGILVVDVTAVDRDLGTNAQIIYSLVSVPDMSDFNITTETEFDTGSQSLRFIGRIRTSRDLDRESRALYNLTVMASDGKYNVTSRVIITVQDVNDNSPVFNMSGHPLNISLNENTPGGTQVIQVRAYDRDEGTNAKISYSIQGGDRKFYMDSNTGILFTTPQQLDRETKDLYNLAVTATDPGNNKATMPITIHVLDVNDNIPLFNSSTFAFTAKEGDVIRYDVIATDADQGTNRETRYRIVRGNDDGMFHIDEITGNLTSVKELDREGPGIKHDHNGNGVYTLVIEAADQGQPQLSSTTDVVIIVEDINDNKPVFSQQSYQYTIMENATRGEILGIISAVDKDVGSNADIGYSFLTSVPGFVFAINSSTGVVSLNGSLDREKMSSYQFTVKASDKGSPSLSSTVPLNIIIQDVNDNQPTFNQSEYHVTLSESIPGGHVVMDLEAIDLDAGSNGEIRYTIIGGSQGQFVIEESTGLIRSLGSLNYESRNSYTLNVSACDGGTPTLQSYAVVSITVTDDNDHRPVFNQSHYSVNISENSPVNSTIITVQAADADQGVNNKVSYSLVNDHGVFSISSDTGRITNVKLLDHERGSSYQLRVQATDGGLNHLSSFSTVTVNVVDVNDNAPQFPQSSFDFRIDEDAIPGRLVGVVTATDRDSGSNAMLSYTLNNRRDIFAINHNSGALSLSRSVTGLANQKLSLNITCRDEGSPSSLATNVTVYVFIMSGLRYRAKLIPQHSNISIYENTTLGEVITRVTVSNGHNIEYTRLDEDHGTFYLNSTTGQVTLVSSLDRETQAIYKLFVAIKDRSERLNSDYGTLTVTVLDVNDNAPTFVQISNVLPISENAPKGSWVTQVKATDPDEGVNGQVFYVIEGQASNTFRINNETGVITTVAALDFETNPFYNITVIAENTLSSVPMRSSLSLVIPVKDVLDFMPTFSRDVFKTSVSEDVELGSVVLDVNATLYDQHSRYIVYRILYDQSSNNSRHFSIDPENGMIRTQSRLDRETTPNYTLIVEARDLRDPDIYTAVTKVILAVDDVNDNVPSFTHKSYTFSPKESLNVGDVVGQIQAADKDKGEHAGIVYDIIAGNQQGYFSINSSTGEIIIAKSLDYEVASSITLTVRAYDKVEVKRTRRQVSSSNYDETTVTIAIQNVNDNPPTFTQTLYLGRFYPEDPENTVIVTVKATDKDSTDAIRYYAVNESVPGVLLLNAQSGQLTRAQSLSDETVQSYTMHVTAKDNNGVVPCNTASNGANVIVFQLSSSRSLTLTIGIPLSLVSTNRQLLISLLQNITGHTVVLKSLQKSPTDPLSTMAVIHLINNTSFTVLNNDQATSTFTNKSKELNQRYSEWNIKVFSHEKPEVRARRGYFSAYIGAMLVFAILIGFTGFIAILVVCRYKYREKHLHVYAPDSQEIAADTSEVAWNSIDYPQIGAYIESRADYPRLITRNQRQPGFKTSVRFNIKEIDESSDLEVPLPETDTPTITSVLSSRYDKDHEPSELSFNELQSQLPSSRARVGRITKSGRITKKRIRGHYNVEGAGSGSFDNHAYSDGNSQSDQHPSTTEIKIEDYQGKTQFFKNPFSRKCGKGFSPRDQKDGEEELPTSTASSRIFTPKHYSPRAYTLDNTEDSESMSNDVYDVHRGTHVPSLKRSSRVRFDLEKDRTTDELEWERQVSGGNTMPDLLNLDSTSHNYDIMPVGRYKNESKTDDSPASSISDGEECEIWNLEDDPGFVPREEAHANTYVITPTTWSTPTEIVNDIQVTIL